MIFFINKVKFIVLSQSINNSIYSYHHYDVTQSNPKTPFLLCQIPQKNLISPQKKTHHSCSHCSLNLYCQKKT